MGWKGQPGDGAAQRPLSLSGTSRRKQQDNTHGEGEIGTRKILTFSEYLCNLQACSRRNNSGNDTAISLGVQES